MSIAKGNSLQLGGNSRIDDGKYIYVNGQHRMSINEGDDGRIWTPYHGNVYPGTNDIVRQNVYRYPMWKVYFSAEVACTININLATPTQWNWAATDKSTSMNIFEPQNGCAQLADMVRNGKFSSYNFEWLSFYPIFWRNSDISNAFWNGDANVIKDWGFRYNQQKWAPSVVIPGRQPGGQWVTQQPSAANGWNLQFTGNADDSEKDWHVMLIMLTANV